MGNTILESIKNKVNKVHAVLDFSIPTSKVVEYSPWSNNKPLIRDKHTGIYIGKMLKEEEGVYNDATLHWMFKFAGENKQWDSQFHIYIGSILYETLAGADYKKEILSLDEQKKKIQELARKANIAPNSLHIPNLWDSHRELFDGLKSHGLEALSTNEPISAITDKTTSLDIAKLLYYAAQTRPLFKKKCMELTPHNLLENLPDNHPLTYYGMVECAFRITDALHGITTQWGLRGQKRYDEIIERILSWKTAIPVLDKAFKQTDESPTVTISKRYFKNDIYKKLLPQEEEKKRLKTKARNITIAIAATIAGIIWGYQYKAYTDKQHAKQERHDNLKRFLGDKRLARYREWQATSLESNIDSIAEKKVKAIENRVHEQSEKFENIYWLGNISRTELEDLMIGVFCNQKEITFLWPKSVDDKDFIRDIFIPAYRPRLENKWFSLIPYELSGNLSQLEESSVFHRMLDLSDSIKNIGDLLSSYNKHFYNVQPLQTYRGRPRTSATVNWQIYIAATYLKDENGQPEYVTIDQGARFVEDYYWGKYPILREIARTLRVRYMNKRDKGIDEVEFELKTVPLLIKTCVLNDLLTNSPQWDGAISQSLIDSLLDNHIMPKIYDKLPCKNTYYSEPYQYLRPYEQALINTIQYNDSDDELYHTSSEKLVARDFKHLWYYIDADGLKYKIVIITYKGKEYFLAGKTGEYGFDPGANSGKEIAQTIIDLRAKKQ